MDADAMQKAYDTLYAETKYGTGRGVTRRARIICDWIIKHMPTGGLVLDASCGRGYILDYLAGYKEIDFQVEGTEASWYLANALRSRHMVHHVPYSGLRSLARRWDAVISSEVLEHMPTEDAARDALCALAACTQRFLCITVSWAGSRASVPGVGRVQLHTLRRDAEWWRAEIAHVARILRVDIGRKGGYYFAEVPA